MATVFGVLVFLLLLSIAIGLVRVTRGPTATDAMLAALLIGTTGTAIAVLLSFLLEMPAALDVALVLALLSVVMGVAFVRCGWPGEQS
jgi:multicomponent Na+:H+ antiporter subunit F